MIRIVLAISIIVLATLACTIQTGYNVAPEVLAVEPLATVEKVPTVAPETFKVLASRLYIRDNVGKVAGFLYQDDLVSCFPNPSGWCQMSDNRRVWSGCLDPNLYGLGCKER